MADGTEEAPRKFASGGYIEGPSSDPLVPAGFAGCTYPANALKDYKLGRELLEWINNTHHKENE